MLNYDKQNRCRKLHAYRSEKCCTFRPYNAKKIEQCYSRAVRLGQRDEVEITWLITIDTIEANIHSLVLSKQSGVDLAIDRQELDFAEVAKEFEGQNVAQSSTLDYEAFAREMLSRGTTRHDYENAI